MFGYTTCTCMSLFRASQTLKFVLTSTTNHCLFSYCTVALTINDLATLTEKLHRISANWKPFGLQLGVDTGTLNNIQYEFRNPGDCLRETLTHWLKAHHEPTWNAVIQALWSSSVNEKQLASSLKTEFCSDTPLPGGLYTVQCY